MSDMTRYRITHPTLPNFIRPLRRSFKAVLRDMGHARRRCKLELHIPELISWGISDDKGISWRTPTLAEYRGLDSLVKTLRLIRQERMRKARRQDL